MLPRRIHSPFYASSSQCASKSRSHNRHSPPCSLLQRRAASQAVHHRRRFHSCVRRSGVSLSQQTCSLCSIVRRFASAASLVPASHVRNLAIIAHVDHGKTTLVDCLLRQSEAHMQISGEGRVMDSNALERERGITILSKCTSITWQNPVDRQLYQLNIVDTPGHADFGGEVERIMSMVDGVCLVVDATDGPMTQTKFVLSKALKAGLKPVVVVNKVDRPTARLGVVENEVFDLFANLSATDDQMDFPIIYTCAKDGWATKDHKTPTDNMTPLFQTIVSHIPSPKADVTTSMSMLITLIDSDPFIGKLLLGKIHSGTIRTGDKLKALDAEGRIQEESKVLKLLNRRGLDQVVVDEARAGDIISVAGFSRASVNSTLCHDSVTQPIPSIPIDPPTLSMSFYVNDSPLAGKNGSHLTSAVIRARLFKEAESNVSLSVIEAENKDSYEVRGRGELQLGILIETMRREGYELSVSSPRVVFKLDGPKKLEPVEDVIIDTDQQFAGTIIEKMSIRRAELLEFNQGDDGRAKLQFRIPTRGLIGYRSELNNDTRGEAIMNNIFHGYVEYVGEIPKNRHGAIISSNQGIITAFALESLESRGVLYVSPGEESYSGHVIGEHNREMDLECNPTRLKHLSNVRSTEKEDKTRLKSPKVLSLEEMIACVRDDEVIEVTSKHIRLRKKLLDAGDRHRANRQRNERRKEDAA